jgi:hypothetical protein
MKRSAGEIEQLPENAKLNWFGHVKQIDEEDLRPGWQRDEEAGLPITGLQRIQKQLGWATLANAMSAARPILATSGIIMLTSGNHLEGVIALAAAALSDAEGKPARWTGTDDPQSGARNDVLADGAAAAAIGLGAAIGGVMPVTAMLGVYFPKLINAANLALAKRRGAKICTDGIDKAVEVGRWLAAGLWVGDYTNVLNDDWTIPILAGTAAVAAGGLCSSYRQIKRRRQAQAKNDFQST